MNRIVCSILRRLAVSTVLLAAGCTRQDVDRAGTSIASAAPEFASDGMLVVRIESRLVAIDPDSALHVAVASHDGAVRLSGKVRSAAIASRFADAARAVAGVRHVDAALTNDPHLPQTKGQVGDFAQSVAVRGALVAQAGVNAVSLGVAAHDGTIVLSGHVKSTAIRSTLLETAKNAPGVRRVVDRLEIRP